MLTVLDTSTAGICFCWLSSLLQKRGKTTILTLSRTRKRRPVLSRRGGALRVRMPKVAWFDAGWDTRLDEAKTMVCKGLHLLLEDLVR